MTNEKKCTGKEWDTCRVEKMGCEGCYYNTTEELEQAMDIILRGNDIESAALILEKCVLDNYIIKGVRTNILKLAVRQILNFIDISKTKGILDYIKDNVKLKNRINELEKENQTMKTKINNKMGLDCYSKKCFYEDAHTGRCLGYSSFNDDEPCEYCKECDALNIKNDD